LAKQDFVTLTRANTLKNKKPYLRPTFEEGLDEQGQREAAERGGVTGAIVDEVVAALKRANSISMKYDWNLLRPEVSRRNLQQWFAGRPPKVAAAIAVRLGLRALPFVVAQPTEAGYSATQRRDLIFAFRFASLGRLAVMHPSPGLEVVSTALNPLMSKTVSASAAAIWTAHAAALEATRDRPLDARLRNLISPGRNKTVGAIHDETAGWRASHAARTASSAGVDGVWEAIEADKSWIAAGAEAFDLLDAPLWLGRSQPDLMPEPFLSIWRSMRSALETDDESWKVWTNWYQDRLVGSSSLDEAIEYFRLTLISDAAVKAKDASAEGQRLWRQEMEANLAPLRLDPRKANRVIAKSLANHA
jgi:hypothetical protein